MRAAQVSFATVLVVVAISTQAMAKEQPGRLALTPQVGFVFPVGDYGKTGQEGSRNPGVALGLDVEYFTSESFALGIRFFYDRFDWIGFPEMIFWRDDKSWRILGFGVLIRYTMPLTEMTDIYGKTGVLVGKAEGFGWLTCADFCGPSEVDVSTALGLQFSIGFIRELSRRVALYSEIGHSNLATDGEEFRIRSFGTTTTREYPINSQWLSFKTGITFYIGH